MMAGFCFTTRLRELLGYREDELDRIDTSVFWHDREQRSKIIASLRDHGGQLLNEKAVWRTKTGQLLNLLVTYAQVAYRGGHISFVGGKRVFTKSWITVRRPWASSTTGGVFSSTIGACATS